MANADRLIELFNEAQARPAGPERECYLAGACAGDSELKEQVISLLQAHEGAGDFLKKEQVLSPPASPPPTVRYFGDYELLEEIARGGMGVVFKARQVTLNRIVAVKMILAGQLARPADVQRFHTEAEAAANLKHPNIVAIHEVGEHEGKHYFSMDYIEGQSLAALVREGPLPAERAARYARIIAQAIHYAHQRGTLHRDLKPSNVLIDAHDQPQVTDFGLAKSLKGDSELTQTGQVLGSPSYMPPEQAMGRLSQMGPASDVYSLGALLYHLLAGRPPFVAETIHETLTQVVSVEPVAPRLLNPSVPRDLETICLKCLEKDPARRYASASELADDLERWFRHEPIRAKPTGALQRVGKWARRRPALAALLVVGLAGLAGVLWEWRAADSARRSAVQEAAAKTRAESEMRRQRDQAATLLSQAQVERGVRLLEQNDSKGLLYLLEARRAAEQLPETRLARAQLWEGWHDHVTQSVARVYRAGRQANQRKSACSPDGELFLSLNETDAVVVREVETGRLRAVLPTTNTLAPTAEFFRDSRHVAIRTPLTEWTDVTGGGSKMEGNTVGEMIERWELSGDSWARDMGRLSVGSTPSGGSEDNRWLVSTMNGGLRLCDLTTGDTRSLEKLKPFIAPSDKLVVSADGRWLAASGDRKVAGADGRPAESGYRLDLFDLAGNEPRRHRLRPPEAKVGFEQAWGLFFTPDGRWLIERTQRELQRYDVRSGAPSGKPFNVGFGYASPPSPDGRWLLFSSNANVLILDIERNEIVAHGLGDGQAPLGIRSAFSPDSSLLALGAMDGSIGIWDMTASRRYGRPFISPAHFETLSFTRDGRGLAAVSADGVVRVHRVATDELGRSPLREWTRGGVLGFSPDGSVLVNDPTGRVLQWIDPVTGQARRSADVGPDPIWQAAFSADGERMATAAGSWSSEDRQQQGLIRLWRMATGTATGQAWPLTNRVRIAFSPDGKTLAAVLADSGSVQLWDMASGQPGEPLVLPRRQSSRDAEILFSPDSRYLATRCNPHSLNFLELATRQWLRRDSSAYLKALSPDWKLALTSEDRVSLIDSPFATDGSVVRKGLGEVFNGTTLSAFSRDSRLFALAHADNSIHLFETATGRPRGQMMKAGSHIHSLAFSPDGRFLASLAQDLPSAEMNSPTASEIIRLRETLREARAILQLWDTSTGQPCGPPAKATALHTELAFSPDGRHVLTVRPDPSGRLPVTAQLWRLPGGGMGFDEMQRRTWRAVGARLDAAGNLEGVPDQEWRRLHE